MIDILLPLRGVQFLFDIITLGLIGYSANVYHDNAFDHDVPSEIAFLVFVSVWTLLVLPYLALAPTFFERYANKFVILGLDALTMLFWFAGFIALAVFKNDITSGSCHGVRVCDTITASIVFGAFEWLLFTATTALAALHVVKTRGSSSSKPAAHAGVQPGGGVATV